MTSRIRQIASRLMPRRLGSGKDVGRNQKREPGGARTSPRPELIELKEAASSAQLILAMALDRSVAPDADLLVLVGRRSRLEVAVPLSAEARGWTVQVGDDDLSVFGIETVDLFVEISDHEGSAVRRRLSAGQASVESPPGAVRRWYSTAEGNISVRRSSAAEVIAEAGVFDVEFYREQVPDLPVGTDPIEHYVSQGAEQGLNPSSMFETTFYRAMNPAIKRRNPLAHFCEYGWKELRNPSPRFNTWWYWSKHLDPADESTNPLAHYEAVGKFEGLSTRPDPLPSRTLGRGQTLTSGRRVRRVCLFAAYDRDGIVDDYVVDYLRELSRYADVFYLADGEMAASELAKLAGVTKGAWGAAAWGV